MPAVNPATVPLYPGNDLVPSATCDAGGFISVSAVTTVDNSILGVDGVDGGGTSYGFVNSSGGSTPVLSDTGTSTLTARPLAAGRRLRARFELTADTGPSFGGLNSCAAVGTAIAG